MFGQRKKQTSFDVNRIAAAAMDAFLAPEGQSTNSREESHQRDGGGIGSIGAVAVGVALAVTARAVYSRARRDLDLEQVADAVEERLSK